MIVIHLESVFKVVIKCTCQDNHYIRTMVQFKFEIVLKSCRMSVLRLPQPQPSSCPGHCQM